VNINEERSRLSEGPDRAWPRTPWVFCMVIQFLLELSIYGHGKILSAVSCSFNLRPERLKMSWSNHLSFSFLNRNWYQERTKTAETTTENAA